MSNLLTQSHQKLTRCRNDAGNKSACQEMEENGGNKLILSISRPIRQMNTNSSSDCIIHQIQCLILSSRDASHLDELGTRELAQQRESIALLVSLRCEALCRRIAHELDKLRNPSN